MTGDDERRAELAATRHPSRGRPAYIGALMFQRRENARVVGLPNHTPRAEHETDPRHNKLRLLKHSERSDDQLITTRFNRIGVVELL